MSSNNGCKRLNEKVAIVTGAGRGLGSALAERLYNEGCKVVVADINYEQVRDVAEKIPGSLAIAVDVTNEEQVNAMVDKTVAEFGKLDLVIANAGIVISGDICGFEAAKWRKVIEVNLFGFFLTAKAAARVMIPQKSGVIIQINSKSGKLGSYKNSAYSASKFAGIGLTQSLALELAEHGVRVNAICPGNLLDSPLWTESLFEQYAKNQGITVEEVRQKYLSKVPLGRGCSFDDVANVMIFLASEQASYMTGQAINVTGGQEMR